MRNNVAYVLLAAIGLAGGALSHRLGTKIQKASDVAHTDTSGSEFEPSISNRFYRFLQWFSTASAADLEARYGILTDADLFQPADLAMREMVLQRWIALDGRQAYHYATSNHRGDLWDLVASPDSIVQRWAHADPVGLLEATVEGPHIDSGVPRALQALVERNPYEAIGHAERLALDVYAFRSIAKAWATLDPRAAMTWALGLPDADRRRYALPTAFDEAPLDIAIEIALKQRDPYMGAASDFLKRWGEQNPEAAGAWLGSLDHDQRSIRALPFDYWRSSWEPARGREFRLDPILVLTALQGLAKHCYEEGRRADLSKVLGRVIGEMATADPNAALGWLNRMPAHLLSDGVMRKLVRGWANQAPEDALSFVDSLPKDYRFGYSKGALRAAARIDLAEAWSTSDPEGAAAWFLAQPEDQRAPLLDKALPILAEYDLEWADALLEPLGAKNSRAHRRLLSKWIARSPEEAADRLLEFLGEPEYAGSFEQLAGVWAKEDLESCSAFVANLAPGPYRDRAVGGMVRSVLRSESVDLEVAAAWTETMAKGELRSGLTNKLMVYATRADPENALTTLHRLEADSPAYGVLARQWYARNPEQASAWLDSLEPGAKQDAALVGVLHEISYDRHFGDWRKAPKIETLPLIIRVGDRERRMEQLRYLFENLQREEAVRLMELHQVRPDDRDEILKQYESIVEERP